MKTNLIAVVMLLIASSANAQNPYVDLSYPWLSGLHVKDKSVRTILLATMDSDNKTPVRQILLSFDQNGLLIKEESLIGFRYSSTFIYDDEGFLTQNIFTDELGSDTIHYVFDKENKTYKKEVTKSVPNSNGVEITETHYKYGPTGILLSIAEYSGTAGDMKLRSETKVEFNNLVLILKGDEIKQTLNYNASGQLLSWQTENETYGISESSNYSYDQNGLLVLIGWEQMGASSKTFVTYQYD